MNLIPILPLLIATSCASYQLEIREASTGRLAAKSGARSTSTGDGINVDPSGHIGAISLRGNICSMEVGIENRYYISRDCKYRWDGASLCFDRARFVDLLGDIKGDPAALEFTGCTDVSPSGRLSADDLLADVADATSFDAAPHHVQYTMTHDVKSSTVCFKVSLEEGCELLFSEISDPQPGAFKYIDDSHWDICYSHDWCSDSGLRFTVADTCGRWTSPVVSLSGFSLRDCNASDCPEINGAPTSN